MRVTADVNFLKALTIADSIFAANIEHESEVRTLAELLYDLVHAVWEPARATEADRGHLAATLQKAQLNMCISPDWPVAGRHAKIQATIPRHADSPDVHAALLQSGIVDFIIRATHPRFEVRRCFECAKWFTRRPRSPRSKFCTARCRNAFHYRKRSGHTMLNCSLCSRPCGLDDISGLELLGGRCMMSGLRTGRALLCTSCVKNHFATWQSYAEGIA